MSIFDFLSVDYLLVTSAGCTRGGGLRSCPIRSATLRSWCSPDPLPAGRRGSLVWCDLLLRCSDLRALGDVVLETFVRRTNERAKVDRDRFLSCSGWGRPGGFRQFRKFCLEESGARRSSEMQCENQSNRIHQIVVHLGLCQRGAMCDVVTTVTHRMTLLQKEDEHVMQHGSHSLKGYR